MRQTSPFFNIFLTCPLGPLTLEEARTLISSPVQHTPYAFSSTETDWLLKQAGQNPFYLQVVCRFLLEEKLRRRGVNDTIDFEYVERSIYQELAPHFDQAWEDLDDNQKIQLKTEIFQNAQPESQFLELSGSHLFRKRLRNTFQDDLTKLSIKDLKDALDHLEDPDFLAQSTLSDFQFISQQIDKGIPNTSIKRGTLVRDLLRRAFEKMRPGDIRNDSALEWRSYNILWYHYFKYHLPNQNTAARLGIGSLRQFYREQDKALQALQKEVLDLEAKALNKIV